MIALGLWDSADSGLRSRDLLSPSLLLVEGELLLKRHRYHKAAARVEQVLAAEPSNRDARLLQGQLQIQAWELDAAATNARALLEDDRRDEAAAILLGRTYLLQKQYEQALQWARRVQQWNSSNAAAYILEAETRFWDQDPAAAEGPLLRALELDPFNADARFSYGYAIWRRVDATQLNDMAAQWDLALEVDPLHYLTHWHWGSRCHDP
jgi:tetratricopeptide (TPR) repeat protein